jgi:cadmium resistance protein CadD (predicted permease)
LALRHCGSYLDGRGTTALVDRSKTEGTLTPIPSHTEISAVFGAMAASVTTFTATNIDDLFLLAVFSAKRVPMRRVIVGQFLGFAGIVAISLIGLWAALTIPRAWFRVLGFLPLAVGIKHLFHMHKNGGQPASKFNVLSIAGITLTNGADNVGIYVPFFAISRSYLWMILSMYAVLLPVWCFSGKWLGGRPIALRFVDRYGHWVVPIVFIGLGVYILIW